MNFNFLKTNKMSIVSLLLVVLASALGVDSTFAMAVDIVTPNRSEDDLRDGLQTDTSGMKTQQQGLSTTATDLQDSGLAAEDIDPRVAKFRPFRFPIEWYIANKCQQVPSNSYEHIHYRSGSTDLEDIYNGSSALTIGKTAVTVPCASFKNKAASLTECSEVFVTDVDGYATDGVTKNGQLALYVVSNDDENVKLVALNPIGTGTISIATGSKFATSATACSESQMVVAPESYLPESDTLYLQKKIATVIITDEWNERAKKVTFIKEDVLHNGLYNFKRKCARAHWLGVQARIDVKVKELNGNREATYFERGILRQIPMLYTHSGDALQFDDLVAINKLQFTKNADSHEAMVFCGSNAMARLQKLINSVTINKNIEFTEINEIGATVAGYHDTFGQLKFIYDPTLDDIGYDDFMVVIDIANAVRYYKRNERQDVIDMKKTGDAREAERTTISMTDCIALKGYNAVLVCPASKFDQAKVLDGISAYVTAMPEGTTLETADKTKKYYLSKDLDGFNAGTIITYDAELKAWKEFEGAIVAK